MNTPDIDAMQSMLDCAFEGFRRSATLRNLGVNIFAQYDGNHLPVEDGLPQNGVCPAIYTRSITPGTRVADTTPEMEAIELKVDLGCLVANDGVGVPFPAAGCLALQLAVKDALVSRETLFSGVGFQGRLTGIEWRLGEIVPLLASEQGPVAYWEGTVTLILLRDREIPERSL